MQRIQYNLPPKLRPYVNCIMTDASDASNGELSLPLYADGYPGLMFQVSENGFYMLPKGKKLSELFLYGQTLAPVTLTTKGKYQFIVFQLYPFASNYLLNVDPRALNDECYDLFNLKHIKVKEYYQKLVNTSDFDVLIQVLSEMILQLLTHHPSAKENDPIQQAIHQIIRCHGQVQISDLLEQVHLTERTLQRKFLHQVGLTPKQFAKIIQFQFSLDQLEQANYDSLTEVGLDSGFADQSHFIRVFKSYTGLSPRQYVKQVSR